MAVGDTTQDETGAAFTRSAGDSPTRGGARALKPPMRIVFVINDLSGGGAEKLLQLTSSFLVSRGHQVAVVTLQSGSDSYTLDRSIQRITLVSGRLTRGFGRIATLPTQARRLSAVLREWDPDICIGNLTRANVALLMTRRLGNRTPTLITEHANTWEVYPSYGVGDRLMRWLVGRFYHLADGVITVSRGVGDGLLDFGVEPEHLHVVYNAIEVAKIQEQARLTPTAFPIANRPTIISVGRHAVIKDHETLIRAFALTRRRLTARLILVGRGPLQPRLEELVKELGLADSVVFAGWQDNPFAWMARSDLFALSSKFEGFGNVIVEAMACGLPVVSTDCRSGPREILRDGEDGVLVPVGDVQALGDAMTLLLSDKQRRAELAEKARRRAADFDISIIGLQYEALLQSFVRSHSAPS